VLDPGEYMEGMMFLLVSFVLCFVVRLMDWERDIQDFILLKQLEGKNRQMQKELELARRIHKTLVPNSISNENVEIEVSYLPAYYVGGDYAKFHFLDKDRMVFIISDVTGHGVSAALLVNRIHAEFERMAKDGKEPGVLLSELDEFIMGDFEGTDMYLSAFCGLLDFKKMRMLYSNHGHPPQCLYHVKGAFVEDLPAQTSMLGLPIDDKRIEQSEVKFEKGDRILLFTDGVTETRTSQGEEYGEDRLESFLRNNCETPPHVFNQQLVDELRTFSGNHKFADDVFILHMVIKGSHGFFN
jgi:sigma-B regulation protein RsbU (phosphoserine phosphatase)